MPRAVQRRAGIKVGQRVRFKVSGGIISIIPDLPAAADEYTPGQRRVIDARLTEARKGPYYGPFETADEAGAFLRKEIEAGERQSLKRPSSWALAISEVTDAKRLLRISP